MAVALQGLVDSLLGSGATPAEWRSELLEGLHRSLGCDSSLLSSPRFGPTFRGKEGFEHIYARHQRAPQRFSSTLDPLLAAVRARGGACVDLDALSDRTRERSAFYDEVVRLQGIESQIVVALEFRGKPSSVLFLCRHGRRSPSFDDADALEIRRVQRALAAAQLAVEAESPPIVTDTLSPREREVAFLISRGLRTREIAAILATSPNTVRNQIARIFKKLEVTTRAELAGMFVADS